jgi:hypothetical protein
MWVSQGPGDTGERAEEVTSDTIVDYLIRITRERTRWHVPQHYIVHVR